MIGCTGSGDAAARGAGLALIGGEPKGRATIISPSGTVEYKDGFEGLEVSARDGGVRFGSGWQSKQQLVLGDYRLWVDKRGRLRMKNGAPTSDEDGAALGA